MRNLEQIQEQQRSSGMPLGTLLLAAAAGGALVVVLMMTFERDAPPAQSQLDPLEQLVQEARKSPPEPAGVLGDEQVTFPGILSDQQAPTTAMAAVKDERGRLLTHDGREAPTDALPHIETAPLASALPKAPLPVGDLLSATPVTQAPKDELAQLAKTTSAVSEDELAPPGSEGGYEIQVASFREKGDADAFVGELRKRGHRAYRQAAYVPDRGLWHRVRVGPFKAKYEAMNYKTRLEDQERISTFLVDPEKVKRQKEIRDAKQAARERKAKRQQERLEAAKKRSE